MTPKVAEAPVAAPWIVSVRWDHSDDADCTDTFTGVGALISDRHVLTSAHLFCKDMEDVPMPAHLDNGRPVVPIAKREFFVRIGGTDIGTGERCEISEIISADFTIKVLLGAPPLERMNDVAVLVLAEPVTTTPIKLASRPIEVGDRVSFLGWPDGPKGHGQLTQVDTVVVDHRAGAAGMARKDEQCAANVVGKQQMANGFSGSPVVRPLGEDGCELVGIGSRGAFPGTWVADTSPPAIFADVVVAQREFILSSTGSVLA
jgi:hypothetical protein